jgi:primase-polymerase (primpol)-like protein
VVGSHVCVGCRFVALTGAGAVGNCLADASAVLPALVGQYFPADVSGTEHIGWTDGPVPEWKGPTDDAELIKRAMRPSANSAFTGKASFADLWEGNDAALGRTYPDANGRPYDASSADAALAH